MIIIYRIPNHFKRPVAFVKHWVMDRTITYNTESKQNQFLILP